LVLLRIVQRLGENKQATPRKTEEISRKIFKRIYMTDIRYNREEMISKLQETVCSVMFEKKEQ